MFRRRKKYCIDNIRTINQAKSTRCNTPLYIAILFEHVVQFKNSFKFVMFVKKNISVKESALTSN